MESILYFIELLFCNRYMKWFTEIFSYIFKKGAFTFLVFISFIIIILILRLIYILYDREHAKKYTGTFVNYFLKIPFSIPWISHINKPKDNDWNIIDKDKGCVIMSNHVSKIDGILLASILGPHLTSRSKFLISKNAYSNPIAAEVFDKVGCFPIPFKSNNPDDCSIDKDEYQKTKKLIDEHLRNNGQLVYFPEGSLNKTPETLMPFRRGFFSTIIEHKLPIYVITTTGTGDLWAREDHLPGNSATIKYDLSEIKDWNDAIKKGELLELDNIQLSEKCQLHMQTILDSMITTKN